MEHEIDKSLNKTEENLSVGTDGDSSSWVGLNNESQMFYLHISVGPILKLTLWDSTLTSWFLNECTISDIFDSPYRGFENFTDYKILPFKFFLPLINLIPHLIFYFSFKN